jgi:nucleotide-binding universal stress UspA family protein
MKPILAASDLSPRGAAVQRRAAALARARGAPLELLHVLGTFASEAEERSAHARLRLVAANLRDDFAVTVRSCLARGGVTARIVERARAVDARLVVIGAGRPSGWRQLLQASHAHAVQRALTAPVLAVASGGASDHRRIVFASDLSSADAATLRAVRGDWPLASILLVYVQSWPVSADHRDSAETQARLAVRRFAAQHELERAVLSEAALGDVARLLRLRAREFGADLLVLSPERSRLKALLGASITQSVLGDPPCDVLLTPREPGCSLRSGRLRASASQA